jgi:hypothetical protein
LKSLITPDFVGWSCVALGLLLRLRQYAENLSLSGDEASLARNLADRTFWGLTQPLDYNQGAPIGFLFVEKLSIGLLGQTDLVLRLLPLVSGLLAMVLIYAIARQHFGTPGLFGVLAFAIAGPLILYSSYLKQYSSDVMLVLLLLYLAGRCSNEKAQTRDFLFLGIAGIAAIWISHPSVFVLPGIGLALAVGKSSRKNHLALFRSASLVSLWLASFGINYVFSLQHLTAEPYLQKYWHDAFVPLPPWSNPTWFVETYLSLLSVTLGAADRVLALICFLLLVIGSVSLWVRSRGSALLAISPLVMAFAASVLQKYPLADRLMLFLVPLVLLLLAEGLGRLYLSIARWNGYVAAVMGAAIIYIVLWHPALEAYRSFRFPARPWDVRPVMEHVRQNWSTSDVVYVSGGGQASYYYADRYGLDKGVLVLKTNHRIVGWWNFKRDVTALAGRDRVWIVFAHLESPNDDRYVKFLRHVGNVEDTFQSSDARAFLLDLNPRQIISPWGVLRERRGMCRDSAVHACSSTMQTCSSLGPCTPRVKVISMSAVRDGPVTNTAAEACGIFDACNASSRDHTICLDLMTAMWISGISDAVRG